MVLERSRAFSVRAGDDTTTAQLRKETGQKRCVVTALVRWGQVGYDVSSRESRSEMLVYGRFDGTSSDRYWLLCRRHNGKIERRHGVVKFAVREASSSGDAGFAVAGDASSRDAHSSIAAASGVFERDFEFSPTSANRLCERSHRPVLDVSQPLKTRRLRRVVKLLRGVNRPDCASATAVASSL